MVEIIIYLSSRQLCIDSYCHEVVVGCFSSPTPTGKFKVDKILLNPKPISPNGVSYPASYLGGKVITFKNTNFAIHGWGETITETMCSSGCIRVGDELLDDLIFKYFYNNITIKP